MNRKNIRRGLMAALSLATAALLHGCGGDEDTNNCSSQNGTDFLCGVTNVEQMISIDDTRWAVGSSTPGGAGKIQPLYFINLNEKSATPLDPTKVTVAEDTATYPCPTRPDFSNLASLGVEFERVNGRDLLFVVSHANGFSIQVFEMAISSGPAVPGLKWIGCVMPPNERFWPDAVAALPDGGLLVTSLFDPTDVNFVAALKSGAPYGQLGEWHPGTGWTEAYPNTFAGPNGVILSKDYNMLFVANWSGHRVTRINRTTNEIATADFSGMQVDNLTWTQDGTKILVGGQHGSIDDTFACSPSPALNCSIPFSIYELDPVTLTKRLLIGPTLLGAMGTGTGALQDGDTLWITPFRGDRVALIQYPM